MKQVTAAALILLGVVFLLPILLIHEDPAQPEDLAPPQTIPPIPQAVQTEPGPGPEESRDRDHTLTLLGADGTVTTLSMADYLWSVVAAEMPASFQLEALKAQAVAARTYSVTKQASGNSRHPEADLCADSTCCQAYITREQAMSNWGERGEEYADKIARAVAETDSLGVLYQDRPIQAVFFSSAPGRTNDAQEVWGSAVPYLVGVDSPEGDEVPNYHAELKLSAGELRELVLAQYPEADLSGPTEEWFQDFTYGASGTVSSVRLGGVVLKGGEVRKLLGLRSTFFTVTAEEEQFTFQTTGYGHGVGMSQYGANALANEGRDFEEILTWYYTGAEVAPLWP